MANPFKIKSSKMSSMPNAGRAATSTSDYEVAKTKTLAEGSVVKTAVYPYDIVNKSYSDGGSGDKFLLNTGDTATGNYTFDTNTLFIDATDDNVGIRTTTTYYTLDVNGNLRVRGSNPILVGGTGNNDGVWGIQNDASGNMNFYQSGQLNNVLYLKAGGNVGIGTANPDKSLEINNSSGNCLRLTYNDANGSAAYYSDFAVSSSGDLTITASGGDVSFDNENLVTTGTFQAGGYKSSDASAGISTTITTASLVGKTITIKDGLITGFA